MHPLVEKIRKILKLAMFNVLMYFRTGTSLLFLCLLHHTCSMSTGATQHCRETCDNIYMSSTFDECIYASYGGKDSQKS